MTVKLPHESPAWKNKRQAELQFLLFNGSALLLRDVDRVETTLWQNVRNGLMHSDVCMFHLQARPQVLWRS